MYLIIYCLIIYCFIVLLLFIVIYCFITVSETQIKAHATCARPHKRCYNGTPLRHRHAAKPHTQAKEPLTPCRAKTDSRTLPKSTGLLLYPGKLLFEKY